MLLRIQVLFYTLLVLSVFEVKPIIAKRSFGGGRHSYPKSGGLSGGGHHSYPSSGGLSGGGHGNPSSGGSHGYPSSGGMSGGSHGYPSSGGMSGNHGYPSSGGMSGSHGYPSSGGSHGYPSSGGASYPSNKGPVHAPTYNNYHYTPPQQISYRPAQGAAPVSYPVYHGAPPTYVYQYKDSGSKYGTLLAGLALLNLGTLGAAAYVGSQRSNNYKPQPGEVCKFGIKKDNGDYEETRIDCQLISSFIMQAEQEKANNAHNSTVVTTTVTNVTMVNTTNGAQEPVTTTTVSPGNVIYAMLPNGTLVPLNGTFVPFNGTLHADGNNTDTSANNTSANNTVTSSVTVTTTTTNTTVTNALDVKGKPVDVTPGMKCFVIRNSPTSNMRKTVPCGLLQTYAEQSIKKNLGVRNVPTLSVLIAMAAVILVR